MNKKMPRTPFSTPLSGSARETELRIRSIFSGPKKRPPILLLALMCAVCLLCGSLVSCQKAGEISPELSVAAPVICQATCRAGTFQILDWFSQFYPQLARTVTLSLDGWDNHQMYLELAEYRFDPSWDAFKVWHIHVYLDGKMIQTILPPETLPQVVEDGWSGPCEGFFDWSNLYEGYDPIVLDLNFDGYTDFGLMADASFTRNIPYVFYLWNPEQEKFDCFGTLNYTIETDKAAQQLLETIYGGNEGDTLNWYAWEGGKLVLIRREWEDFLGSPFEGVKIDGMFCQEVITHIYVRENGKLVQKEDESHFYPAG